MPFQQRRHWRLCPQTPSGHLFLMRGLDLRLFWVLVSGDVAFADDDHDDDADDDGDFAVACRAVSTGGQPEVVGKGGAEQETNDGQGTVRVPFTGENELTEGAAAEKHTGETDKQHAQRVPQPVHMGDWLASKARVK